MILGVGIDSVPISRMEQELKDRASGFFTGSFTAGEIRYCQEAISRNPARHFAARFAAKEAFFKAIGLTMASRGKMERVMPGDFPGVEIVISPEGFPTLVLHDRAKKMASDLGIDKVWVSITHDDLHATAVVILEG